MVTPWLRDRAGENVIPVDYVYTAQGGAARDDAVGSQRGTCKTLANRCSMSTFDEMQP